jgi:Cytochrome c7 and related cytochrome c
MPAPFPRWTNTLARATLIAVVCVLVGVPAALMAWVRTPNATREYQPVAQPVAFDHRIHVVGQHIDCLYCHYSAERSASAGIPPTSECVPCHSTAWMSPDVFKPVRESVASGHALQWRRVDALPGFVYFNHAIHVNKGVGCESCHGRVDRMGQVYQSAPLTMQWCVNCHRNPAAALRPLNAITTMGFTPTIPQNELGAQLVQKYHVRSLTNCTTCHR